MTNAGSSDQPEQAKRRIGAGTIVAVVAAAALLLFIFQNTREVPVDFLWASFTIRLAVLLIITAALGALVALAGQWLLRRQRSRQRR